MSQNQHQILQVIAQIPRGKVLSYGEVAARAGLPGAARLVGHTLKNLPQESKLPWHRVLNSQGHISLPHDSESYKLQRERLESEGIVFIKNKVALKKYGW